MQEERDGNRVSVYGDGNAKEKSEESLLLIEFLVEMGVVQLWDGVGWWMLDGEPMLLVRALTVSEGRELELRVIFSLFGLLEMMVGMVVVIVVVMEGWREMLGALFSAGALLWLIWFLFFFFFKWEGKVMQLVARVWQKSRWLVLLV